MDMQDDTDWTRIYEAIDDVSRGIDCFEDEGGPGLDDSRNRSRPTVAVIIAPMVRSMLVRDIEDGRGRAISPHALARDDRGWWVDLDTVVSNECVGPPEWAAIRRPDRTSGEYEVCFDVAPGGREREPSVLPGGRSWCHVEVVAGIPSSHGMAVWRGDVAARPSLID